jgi:hypothetical protein
VVEEASALSVQITQAIDLKLVCQHSKQQMAGQVRGRRSPEHRVPTVAKFAGIEIAYARNLDVELFSIRQRRTDPYARHGIQATRLVECRVVTTLPALRLAIW